VASSPWRACGRRMRGSSAAATRSNLADSILPRGLARGSPDLSWQASQRPCSPSWQRPRSSGKSLLPVINLVADIDSLTVYISHIERAAKPSRYHAGVRRITAKAVTILAGRPLHRHHLAIELIGALATPHCTCPSLRICRSHFKLDGPIGGEAYERNAVTSVANAECRRPNANKTLRRSRGEKQKREHAEACP